MAFGTQSWRPHPIKSRVNVVPRNVRIQSNLDHMKVPKHGNIEDTWFDLCGGRAGGPGDGCLTTIYRR